MNSIIPSQYFAPFATLSERSRGRRIQEPPSRTRTPFQRDRDRIIHSSAFRRLKQKTQVFVAHEGDHFRTRLTHSIEVTQIARSLARTLRLDEDLAESLALAHDLGHAPFGHTGEDVLNECMAPFGGFDHNAQTLRIVTKLERRYPDFDGLNLTWETLEGLVKHNGPLLVGQRTLQDLPQAIVEYCGDHDLELASFAGPEAQVAALSDDIAYNNHDIDDGLKAGLFTIDDICSVPLVGDMFATVRRSYPGLDTTRLIGEVVRRLIGVWIDDLEMETRRRIDTYRPETVEDVRAMSVPLVAFSDAMDQEQAPLREFLYQRMYRHWKVDRKRSQAKRILKSLFDTFFNEPGILPPIWGELATSREGSARARVVCDYIAGMTDVYAIDEYKKLFSVEALGG